MFEINVENSFSAGHALRGYQGKCENPHGHNYKVRITVAGDLLDDIGLLCDFKDVKALMNRVIDRLDHQYLNDLEPFRQFNPSAEIIARHFYKEIAAPVLESTGGRARLQRVQVWETDRNSAVYSE